MNILFENEAIDYLRLPSIPKKKWDGKKSFSNGLAVITILNTNESAYAVCSFDSEIDAKPRITHVFSNEQFAADTSACDIFVVPEYMDLEARNELDLDEESASACKELIEEAKELESGNTEEDMHKEGDAHEWVFPEIHNMEEAEAWIRNYKKTNKISGRIPATEESMKSFLYVAASDLKKLQK